MKRQRLLAPLVLLIFMVPVAFAQEAKTSLGPAEGAEGAAEASLKLQVVITEYAGTQKVSSLPYTLYGAITGPRGNCGSVRTGTKVPINGGTFTTPNGTTSGQVSYQDIGTNIDCRLITPTGTDGRYHFSFTVQRSSVVAGNGTDLKPGEAIPTGEPLIRSFQDSFDVLLRDNQTIEGSSSVDPATGNVMKVDVTLNVEK